MAWYFSALMCVFEIRWYWVCLKLGHSNSCSKDRSLSHSTRDQVRVKFKLARREWLRLNFLALEMPKMITKGALRPLRQ